MCLSSLDESTAQFCKTLISTIVQNIQEGKLIQEIIPLVQEKIISSDCQGSADVERAITTFTKDICNAMGIKEEQLLETLEKQNVPVFLSSDLTILNFIMAIELTCIECTYVQPVDTMMDLNGKKIMDVDVNKEKCESKIDEDKTVNIGLQPELSSNDFIPKFSTTVKNIHPADVAMDRITSQVSHSAFFGLCVDIGNLTLYMYVGEK